MKTAKRISGSFFFITMLFINPLFFKTALCSCGAVKTSESETIKGRLNTIIELPNPVTNGEVSLERTLSLRRSVRNYSQTPLNLEEIGQMLWAAQGVTESRRGFRTAPSAGATFPLRVYVMVNRVSDINAGIYLYHPNEHRIKLKKEGEFASNLAGTALGQSMFEEASAVFIISAVFENTTQRYGDRGIRYVYNEVGHAAQNLLLQAVALEAGVVVVGAFNDEAVNSLLELPAGESVIYLLPAGKLLD
ncbi:SagB/ThcOx family dehydrogenase [Natronoflexus pectinivorans]|uniref:SagB-type dehydrogenase family enzyme n=1 Tax=Natronoflexus pectinivorans TaxID=682526 RepID=A0A4R2GKT1_9BACT|nr:SagB/ThcOx family dehydrogenase [Natronoflexus pectinivorans]TCO09186.1 SagB-type dehydrogenase family enzyme [Natronoflexus pectinivorans]